MTDAVLETLEAGPQVTVQDIGRPGWMRHGVTEGGAMDVRAMEEGRVLLSNAPDLALLEFVAQGGKYCARHEPINVALTGARFDAMLEDRPIEWRSSFQIKPGQVLKIGRVIDGNYGYLSVGGGIASQVVLGSRSTHLRASFGGFNGRCLEAGDLLPIGTHQIKTGDFALRVDSPKQRRNFNVLWGAQAHLFSENERRRFIETEFRISHELDRMGARLQTKAAPISLENGLGAISDAVALGDIQIPGDGRPIVLLRDRQPTGGYPRIATIITADICDFIQLTPGSPVRFRPVTEDEAVNALNIFKNGLTALADKVQPSIRNVNDMSNLLSYNLISGVVKDGDDLPWETS